MKPETTKYKGKRFEYDVKVWVDDKGLSPDYSLMHVNHSPTGFEWGYSGSGPSQLAFAILLDFTSDAGLSMRHYQAFKRDFIAGLDRSKPWTITGAEIQRWLYAQ